MDEVVEKRVSENDLAMFTQRVNDLLECKYILASKRIASLLKGVVSISVFTESVAACLKNFSYATEFARNRLLVSDGDGVKAKMTLPVDRLRLFTFVFCLLAEIDSGERDFTKFLSEYFGDETNESYRKFCAEIIVPFKKAGEFLLREANPDGVDAETAQKGMAYFGAETIYVSSAVYDSVITLLNKVKAKADNDFQGGGDQRAECVEMTDAFINAFLSKNPKLIRIVWIGFKNTLLKVRGFEREVAAIKNILIEANLA